MELAYRDATRDQLQLSGSGVEIKSTPSFAPTSSPNSSAKLIQRDQIRSISQRKSTRRAAEQASQSVCRRRLRLKWDSEFQVASRLIQLRSAEFLYPLLLLQSPDLIQLNSSGPICRLTWPSCPFGGNSLALVTRVAQCNHWNWHWIGWGEGKSS